MLTMRRSRARVQKNVADVDENSLIVQPPSIHASMAVMNTCVRFAPATTGRESKTVPCMLRTTYQRGEAEDSSGLKAARRRTMHRKYSVHGSHVHPVPDQVQHCMKCNWAVPGHSIGVMYFVGGQLVE